MQKISIKWKIQPEDPVRVKQVVVGYPEMSEKKSQVQNISISFPNVYHGRIIVKADNDDETGGEWGKSGSK